MNKKIFTLAAILMLITATGLFAQNAEATAPEAEQTIEASASGMTQAVKYIAAAVAVSVACLSGALAVSKIGTAAMGAMSENAEVSGKALTFLGLAEGICLWGFLVALIIVIM